MKKLLLILCMLVGLFAIFAAPFFISGCGASVGRAEARGFILTGADAFRIADETCARQALSTNNHQLAVTCAAAYDRGRTALVAAASGVDAWDEGKKGHVMCSIAIAVGELKSIANELKLSQKGLPPVIDDALFLMGKISDCSSNLGSYPIVTTQHDSGSSDAAASDGGVP